MLLEILKRTPSWVFILFLVVVIIGYSQSRGRTISRGRVAILPVAMIVLSFYGVLSAFNFLPTSLICWALGLSGAVLFGLKLALPRGVTFSPEKGSFFVPGSWIPFALIMAIFFTKYAVGVILARQLAIGSNLVFVAGISLCYGLFSGVFLVRAIIIWRTVKSCHQVQRPSLPVAGTVE